MKINSGTKSASPALSKAEDVSGVHLWLILRKAEWAVEQRALESIAATGLGLSEFAALELLLHKGPQPVNTVGKKILLTSGSVTTAIDRLEAKALVRRKPHPTDQRTRLVELTAKGRKLIERAFAKHRVDMESTTAVLNHKERSILLSLLKKWGYAAEKSSATLTAKFSLGNPT